MENCGKCLVILNIGNEKKVVGRCVWYDEVLRFIFLKEGVCLRRM